MNYFMVQLKGGPSPTFLSRVGADGRIYETWLPTCATQLNFAAASEVVRRLRLKGFEAAAVCDLYGELPSVKDLAAVKQSVQAEVASLIPQTA